MTLFKTLVLVNAVIILNSCATLRPVDSVVSKKAEGGAKGTVYYLPITALYATVPVSIVEYKHGAKTYYAAEIREQITLKTNALPDPKNRYVIQSDGLSANPFIGSNLSFALSELGLLTNVSAVSEDKTLDAAASGIKLVGDVLRLATGIPSAPETVGQEPNKLEFSPGKTVAEIEVPYVYVPGYRDEPKLEMPTHLSGNRLDFVDSFEVKVESEFLGQTGDVTSVNDEKAGIFYRTPKMCKVTSVTTQDYGGGGKLESKSSAFFPIMQFGSINSVPVQSKRFTKRTTTITFDESGALTKYGVESGSSAKQVLDSLNDGITEARNLQSEIAKAKAAEEAKDLAKKKQAFANLKKLQAYVECADKGGDDCSALLQEYLQGLSGIHED